VERERVGVRGVGVLGLVLWGGGGGGGVVRDWRRGGLTGGGVRWGCGAEEVGQGVGRPGAGTNGVKGGDKCSRRVWGRRGVVARGGRGEGEECV